MQVVRTTLNLDADVALVLRELATRQGSSLGKVASDLVRRGLSRSESDSARDGGTSDSVVFLGFRPLPERGVVVTNDLVNAIREAEGI
jgi:hypothetical protein